MQFPVFATYAGSPRYAPLVPLKEGEGYTLPGDSGSHLLFGQGPSSCCILEIPSRGGGKTRPSYHMEVELHKPMECSKLRGVYLINLEI